MPHPGHQSVRPSLLIASLLFAPLMGCGSSSPQPAVAPPARTDPSPVQPVVARVAAASDLRLVFPLLRSAFRHDHPGYDCEPTFGSSGQFFAQISAGAPFDLFLSADRGLTDKLAHQLAPRLPTPPFNYATGQLVFWVPAESSLDLTPDLASLLRNHPPQNIALANPQHAPYGRAALQALQSWHLADLLSDRLIYADNVAQALQFADSGGAHAAIVARSLVVGESPAAQGRWIEIPPQTHEPIRQAGLVLTTGPAGQAAQAFAHWLMSTPAQSLLQQHGFLPPG